MATFGKLSGVAPLPGETSKRSEDMRMFLVALKVVDPRDNGAITGRRARYLAGLDWVRQFKDRVRSLLEEQGLVGECATLGDDTSLPVLPIVATRAVADLIRGMPEVETVVEDTENIRLEF